MDRSHLAVATAAASAIGYAAPLLVGLATGHAADGVTASTGALIVGFANLGGRYRLRSATLLATTLAAGVAALVGGLAGPSVAATVALIGLWGFAGGLLVALGTRAAFAGMLSTWALLLAGDLHLHGGATLHEAWLITTGGLAQSVVAIALWPLRPFAAERHAVADGYRALAAYARAPATVALQRTATALESAAATVGPGQTPAGERETLRAMVEQGEWIRVEIASVSRSDAPGVGETLSAAATVLDKIAAGDDPAPALTELGHAARGIADPGAASLVGWIAAAAGASGAGAPGPAPRPRWLDALRAELRWRSRAFRHALRLGVALIVAGIMYRDLALGSGYWVPLTVLFVLRPDYGTTVTRAIGRAAGTMAGVTIAWALVTLVSPSAGVIVALLALLAWAAYLLFPANYALFSVVLTVLIALLVQFSGGSPVGALLDRILDTVLGTAIALGAITLWPTREAPRTRECLKAYLTAEREWLDAILAACAEGDDRVSLRATRLAARRARAEARDAVVRALAEPARRRPDGQPLHGLLAAMDRVSESALVLAAAVHDGARAPRAALAPYRTALDAGFDQIACSLDGGVVSAPVWMPADTVAAGREDPALALVAAEAGGVLAALAQLGEVWRERAEAEPAIS